MHNLEYALVILGTEVEKNLDKEIGRRILELASFSHEYKPPKRTDTDSGGPPSESYLSSYIKTYVDNSKV